MQNIVSTFATPQLKPLPPSPFFTWSRHGNISFVPLQGEGYHYRMFQKHHVTFIVFFSSQMVI
jgi:hypothetical protein